MTFSTQDHFETLGVLKSTFAAALMLVEDYTKAFERDMPSTMRVRTRLMQPDLDNAFWTSSRGRALDDLTKLFQSSDHGGREFTETFKDLVYDLDCQYLEIRSARKKLFDHDTEDTGCDIDPESWRCDEHINWLVNEPTLFPKHRKLRYRGDYTHWR